MADSDRCVAAQEALDAMAFEGYAASTEGVPLSDYRTAIEAALAVRLVERCETCGGRGYAYQCDDPADYSVPCPDCSDGTVDRGLALPRALNDEQLDACVVEWRNRPHRYTVDVILHGLEPFPCVRCGGARQDPRHLPSVPVPLYRHQEDQHSS